MPSFYEFFAGGGMARAGLGPSWDCLFANDIDPQKAATYMANWGRDELWIGDVNDVTTAQLPSTADLSWASFPCQDLSLAGAGAGIRGERSGTFWPFWNLMERLSEENRAPKIIVLENVYGALRSNKGQDFVAISSAFANLGYRFGALVIDAKDFIPQSRQRLFIVGVRPDVPVPNALFAGGAVRRWHPVAVTDAFSQLEQHARERWVWWNMPDPPPQETTLADIIEEQANGVKFHSPKETEALLSMMSHANLNKVMTAQKSGIRAVGTVYKRTRNGIQRAEARFDGVAGCLRTPTGGSSRQTVIIVDADRVRSRLLSPREAARLMGLPDSYKLPDKYNDAYHLAGDGVAVPVVRFLARCIIEPVLVREPVGEVLV